MLAGRTEIQQTAGIISAKFDWAVNNLVVSNSGDIVTFGGGVVLNLQPGALAPGNLKGAQ